jgi:hypothetical protein
LVYYDKTYCQGLTKRDQTKIVEIDGVGADALTNARLIIAQQNELIRSEN